MATQKILTRDFYPLFHSHLHFLCLLHPHPTIPNHLQDRGTEAGIGILVGSDSVLLIDPGPLVGGPLRFLKKNFMIAGASSILCPLPRLSR